MPGLVKIGRSIHGGKSRAKDLYKTGVPTSFQVAFEILVDDPIEVEAMAHEQLATFRFNETREFFQLTVSQARLAILKQLVWAEGYEVVTSEEQHALIEINYLSDASGIASAEIVTAIRDLNPSAIRDALGLQKKRRQMTLADKNEQDSKGKA